MKDLWKWIKALFKIWKWWSWNKKRVKRIEKKQAKMLRKHIEDENRIKGRHRRISKRKR